MNGPLQDDILNHPATRFNEDTLYGTAARDYCKTMTLWSESTALSKDNFLYIYRIIYRTFVDITIVYKIFYSIVFRILYRTFANIARLFVVFYCFIYIIILCSV